MIKNKEKILTLAVIMTIISGNYPAIVRADVPGFNLPSIIVEAEAEKTLPGGFVKENSSIGFTGTQNVMEAPYKVVTIDQKAIKSFAGPAEGIVGALSLDPSVRIDRSGTYTDISIRGIYGSGHNMYVNGIPGLLGQENIPFYWVDSATVISGPNQGVNATGLSEAVGGSVNFQSKRALMEDNANLKLAYKGGTTFEEGVDVGRRFGKDKKWGLRVTADNVSGGEYVRKNEKLTQTQFFMNLDQKSEKSTSNLLLGYARTKHSGGPGALNFQNTVTSLPDAPDAKTVSKPSWSYNEYENWIAALNHEQKLSKHVAAYVNAGYHKEDWYGYIDGSVNVIDND